MPYDEAGVETDFGSNSCYVELGKRETDICVTYVVDTPEISTYQGNDWYDLPPETKDSREPSLEIDLSSVCVHRIQARVLSTHPILSVVTNTFFTPLAFGFQSLGFRHAL